MKRYRDSRAKEMAKINTDFAAKALVLKKQAMQAGKLEEASQAETLVKDWTGKPDLAAKPKPKTVEDLKEYLHGTTWEVSNHKPDTEVIWILTFDKNGSFKHSVAGTAKWTAQSVTNIKLWDYDPLTFNKDYTRFKAVGAAGTYFGKLVP